MDKLFKLVKQVFQDKKNIFEWHLLLANVINGGVDQGLYFETLMYEQLKKLEKHNIIHCKGDGKAADVLYGNCDIFLKKEGYGANIKSNTSTSVMTSKCEPSNSYNIKIFDNSRNKRKTFNDRIKELKDGGIILSISFDKEQFLKNIQNKNNLLMDPKHKMWVALTSLEEIREFLGKRSISEIFNDPEGDHVKIKLKDLINTAKNKGRFLEINISEKVLLNEKKNCEKCPIPFMYMLYYSHKKYQIKKSGENK